MFDLVQNIESCYYSVPEIIYYSHYGAAIAALVVGFFVLFNNRKSLQSVLLFALSVNFAIWASLDLVTWVDQHSGRIMSAWSTLIAADLMMYVLGFYLLFVFLYKRDLPFYAKLILFVAVLPTVLLAPTTLNILYFDAASCNAIDGFIAEKYLYGTEFIIYLAMVAVTLRYFLQTKTGKSENKKVIYFSGSLLLFLGIFLSTNSLASYYDTNEFLWSLTQYGLFGMVLFMAVLGYLIVKFKAFQIKLLAAQALVVGLIILLGSQLFFVETTINTILVLTTLLLATTGGYLLVKSVKNEVKQREELEVLTTKLEHANERLKELDKQKSEFVSIASHQLRSPLTAIRGYASLLVDGDYGKIPKKAQEPLERIQESSRLMAIAIEDYLNVSRIEAGNMKYNLADFNLRDETEHVCDDLRSAAIKKGLVLLFRTDLKSRGVVNADIGKTVQIIQNLINNAIKYTEEGTIRVLVHDNVPVKKIYVDIIDTGIGMNEEALDRIFEKFERASNANTVNVHGTGLGLFVALKMAEAMGGGITAHSDGDGKGSRFTLELPLAL